jgi:hypothetical protein
MRSRFLVVTALAVGCSVTGGSDGEGLRVPQCNTYAEKLASCFHRPDMRANVVAVAHSKEERDQMALRCDQASTQLRTACP